MSKKIKRDLSTLKEKASGLLSQEEITRQMLALQQGENPANPETEEQSTNYRKKYTTMMHPDLSLRLRKEALDMGISAAELLERILLRHFDRH